MSTSAVLPEFVIGSGIGVRELAWEWATAVVSAVDGMHDFIPESSHSGTRRLRLVFTDTTDATKPTAFTARHAQELLEFADSLTPVERTHVIVHCNMGVSRSPALAYALDARFTGSADLAISTTLDARTFAMPNALVVWMLDEALGTENLLWATFEKWVQTKAWWPHPHDALCEVAKSDALRLLSEIKP